MHTVATNWRGRVRKHLPQRFEQIAHAKAEQESPIVAGKEVPQIVGKVDVRWVDVFVALDDLVAALLVDGVEDDRRRYLHLSCHGPPGSQICWLGWFWSSPESTGRRKAAISETTAVNVAGAGS